MSGIKIKPGESEWTEKNLRKLVVAIKSNFPEGYRKSVYSRAMKHVNWKKVAFPPFSSQDCQKRWKDVLSKMRRVRTLTEILDEAEQKLSYATFRFRIHPTVPKKPKPPCAIFYEENWAKFRKQNPKLTQNDLLELVAKQYKALSDEEKAPYVEKHKIGSQEYAKRKLEIITSKRKRKRNSAHTPDESNEVQYTVSMEGEPHIEDGKGLPPKPPINGYHLFCKEQQSSMAGESHKSYVKVWGQRWRDMTESQRDTYRNRCTELKKKYATELNEYLNTFDEKAQEQILNKNGIKRPKAHREGETFPEPKMPARSTYNVFSKKQMELLKKEIPNTRERMRKCSQMWKDLSKKEKQRYKLQAFEKLRKYSVELQEWFKTLTAAEQEDYLKHNPSKCQYLDVEKAKNYFKIKEPCLHRSSDSEDEFLEVSSSEEEEYNYDYKEDEEQEEEEGDITFDMY